MLIAGVIVSKTIQLIERNEEQLNKQKVEIEKLQQQEEKLEKILKYKDRQIKALKQAKSSEEAPKKIAKKVIAPAHVRLLVAKYFPAHEVENALAVCKCESGFNANAQNWGDAKITGMPSMGLFQINANPTWNWDDPESNVKRAYLMWKNRGWQPWSCSRVL